MSENLYSWVCPACSRRVPSRLNSCRCGHERDPALEPSQAEVQADDASDGGGVLAVGRVVVGAIVIVAVTAFAATRIFRPAPATEGDGRGQDRTARSQAELELTEVSPGPLTTADMLPDRSQNRRPAAPGDPPPYSPLPSAPPVAPAPFPAASTLEDVIGAAVPGVVSIETGGGRGSGFFVGPGVIITNHHVVEGNVSVTVRLSSGDTLPGRVERTSVEVDLAIVRVDNPPPAQPLLRLGSAKDVRVGQEVIAIGLAMGQFQGTVTRGIISAIRRAGPNASLVLLQTDAAINPGNSGGPLIDRSGRVVGITTLKVAGDAESLGFAVAADHARAFLDGSSVRSPSAPAGAQSSAPLVQAFTGKSESELRREQGLQLFEQSLGTVATRAGQIDTYWGQIKAECDGRATGVYEREWFALWDNRLLVNSSDANCLAAVANLEQAAAQVRDAMDQLHEAARRAAVFPGDVRRARSKFDLDWVGWDR